MFVAWASVSLCVVLSAAEVQTVDATRRVYRTRASCFVSHGDCYKKAYRVTAERSPSLLSFHHLAAAIKFGIAT